MKLSFRSMMLAAAFALVAALPIGHTVAQTFTLPNLTVVTNMLMAEGKKPVGTGCTIGTGSTDMAGTCLTTSTSGSIAFGQTYSFAPSCLVVDRTTTPVAVYAVTTTQITLTTVTNAHNLQWMCVAQAQ